MAKKTKKAAPQSRETAGIKSFLDMIAPSVVKFEPDHFICGNTFRCVWALREYPTQTDEQAIVTTVAVHPTCIPYSKAAEKRSPPPREDCAYLLDPGEVHDGPPRRTHSIGDLIQRKNSSRVTSQNP